MAYTSEGSHVSLIIPGDKNVDLKAVARTLEVNKIRLFAFEIAHTISGYPPGGTPSVGYSKPLIVVLDEELTEYEQLLRRGINIDATRSENTRCYKNQQCAHSQNH